MQQGRVRRGPAARKSLRLDPRYLQPWENLAPVQCGPGSLTWKLVPPLLHELHALQQAVHLGLDVAQLGLEAVQLLGLDWGVGAEGAAAGTSKPTLPAEGLPAPHYPASEGCVPPHSRFISGGNWLFLGALWGLKRPLAPVPRWALRILTGTRWRRGGTPWCSYTLWGQDRGSRATSLPCAQRPARQDHPPAGAIFPV